MNPLHIDSRRRANAAFTWSKRLHWTIEAVPALARFPLARGTSAAMVLATLLVSAAGGPLIPGEAALAGQSLTEEVGFRQGMRLIEEPAQAPEIAFLDETGRYRGFVEFRGQVVIALFWATWCPICAHEMPKLDRLQAEFDGAGLRVLALSQDSGGADAVKDYYDRRGISHLEIFVDQEAILASVLGIRGVPTVFVIDPAGRMVAVNEGAADWESPDVAAFLRQLLEQR